MRNRFIVIIFLLILLLVLGIFIKKNNEKNLQLPVDIEDKTSIAIEIEPGMSVTEIGQLLYDNNLIKSKKYFSKYIKENNLENLKSGYYELSRSESLLEISEKLNNGSRPIGIKVTFPEGYTGYQFSEILYDNGIISSKDDFIKLLDDAEIFYDNHVFLKDNNIKVLEGYLFPDTYFFKKNTSSLDVVDTMLYRFEDVLKDNDIFEKVPDKFTLNQIITLASIIQKEASNEDQMPLISGVFYNRLNTNMPLQSCATVEFELGRELTVKERLSAEDIRRNSPYNTYIHSGLPPTPISSVSLDAILASVNPQNSDYFYFVADKDGNNLFSKTYEEHLAKTKEIYGEY